MPSKVENLIAALERNYFLLDREGSREEKSVYAKMPKSVSGDEVKRLMKAAIKKGNANPMWIIHWLLKEKDGKRLIEVTDFSPADIVEIIQFMKERKYFEANRDILKIFEISKKQKSADVEEPRARSFFRSRSVALQETPKKEIDRDYVIESAVFIFTEFFISRELKDDFLLLCKEGEGAGLAEPATMQKLLLAIAAAKVDSSQKIKAFDYIFTYEDFQNSLAEMSGEESFKLLMKVAECLGMPASRHAETTKIFKLHLKRYGIKIFEKINNSADLNGFLALANMVGTDVLFESNDEEGGWVSKAIASAIANAKQEDAQHLVRDKIIKTFVSLLENSLSDSTRISLRVGIFLKKFDALKRIVGTDASRLLINSLSPKSLMMLHADSDNLPKEIRTFLESRIAQVAEEKGVVVFLEGLFMEVDNHPTNPRRAVTDGPTIRMFESLKKFLVLNPQDPESQSFMRRELGTIFAKDFVQMFLDWPKYPEGSLSAKEISHDSHHGLHLKRAGDFAFLYNHFPLMFGWPDINHALSDPNIAPTILEIFAKGGTTKVINDLIFFTDHSSPYRTSYIETFTKILEGVEGKVAVEDVDKLLETLSERDFLSPSIQKLLRLVATRTPESEDKIISRLADKVKEISKRSEPFYISRIQNFFEGHEAEKKLQMERRLLEKLDEFTMLSIYQSVSPENKKYIKEKMGAYCEKYGFGTMLFVLSGMQNRSTLISNLHDIKDSLTLNPYDPYLMEGEVMHSFSGFIRFIEILMAANSDKSVGADISLGGDGILVRGMAMKQVKDVTLICRLYPELITPDIIDQIAQKPQVIAAINNNINHHMAQHVSKESQQIFEKINARIPDGAEKIATARLLPMDRLVKLKQKFSVAKKKPPRDVASSNVFRMIQGPCNSFMEFYEGISEAEREALNLFVAEDKDFDFVRNWLMRQLQNFEAELEPLLTVTPKDLTGLTGEERKKVMTQLEKKQKLNAIVRGIEGFQADKAKSPDQERESIISSLKLVLESKSEKEREDLPPEIKEFSRGMNNIQHTQALRAAKDGWYKFRENLNLFRELATLSDNNEEFLNQIATAMSLITQPNCPSNLAVNLEKILEEKRYKGNPKRAAFALALSEVAWGILNSSSDIILNDRRYEDVFLRKEEDGEQTFFAPSQAFFYLVGKYFEELVEKKKPSEAELAVAAEDTSVEEADLGGKTMHQIEQDRQAALIKKGREIMKDLGAKKLPKILPATIDIESPQASSLAGIARSGTAQVNMAS